MTDTPAPKVSTTNENAYGRSYPLEDPIPQYAPILWLAYTMIIFGVIGIFVGTIMLAGGLVTFKIKLLLLGLSYAASSFVTFCLSYVLFAIRDIARNSFKSPNK